MSICAAHCSWVCCSKSTNRMASYSSSVSRIGSVFSHPLGQKVSTCGMPQIRRHRSGLGIGTSPFVSGIYRLYNVIRELSIGSERFTTLEVEGHPSVCVDGYRIDDGQPELFVKLGNGI